MENAEQIYRDASVIFERRGYGRTLSLCIVGTEEIGKALLYTIAAVDGLPCLRSRLTRMKSNPSREHELKQLLEEYFCIAADLVQEYLSEIGSEEYGTVSHAYRVAQIINLLLQDSSSEILKKPFSAKKHFKERKKFALPIGDNLTTEERKWRGLYVDILDDHTVHSPSSVSEIEAKMAFFGLKTSIEEISSLNQVLISDDEWVDLKREIGNL